jgi:hypothetical protein
MPSEGLYAFAGESVDSYTAMASDGGNPNAFTGGQNVDPFSGSGSGDTASLMLAFDIGTIEVNGAADTTDGSTWLGVVSDSNGVPQYNVFSNNDGVVSYVPIDPEVPFVGYIFPNMDLSEPASTQTTQPSTPPIANASVTTIPDPVVAVLGPQPGPAPDKPTPNASVTTIPGPVTTAPGPQPTLTLDSSMSLPDPPPALQDLSQIQQSTQPGPQINTPQAGQDNVPYDPMADSPVAKWLLYGHNTPIRDFFTSDANLKFAQDTALVTSIGAAAVATGGLAMGGTAFGFGAGAGGAATFMGTGSGVALTSTAARAAVPVAAILANPGTQQELEEIESELSAFGPELESAVQTVESELPSLPQAEEEAVALSDRVRAAWEFLRANPDVIRQIGGSPPGAPMSDQQLKAAIRLLNEGNPGFARAFAGNAMQAMVEASNYESGSFNVVARPFERAIDFTDISGLSAELTTEAAANPHTLRAYLSESGAMIFRYSTLAEWEEYLRGL